VTGWANGDKIWGWTSERIHRCVCDKGFVGNGVTCAHADTGVVFEHVQVESNVVRLTMNLSRDATVDEGLWEEKPLGENTEQVLQQRRKHAPLWPMQLTHRHLHHHPG